MQTEFEITFTNINREDIVLKIQALWWKCIQPRTHMKRVVFRHPTSDDCFARIRDGWDKITCTYKDIRSWKLSIDSVKEIECEVSDFESLRQIFVNMGVFQKAYQETYRETWNIWDDVYFMIDEWPWLHPFIEIEGANESVVKDFAQKLGFDYSEWLFGAVGEIYYKELWIPRKYINSLEIITFDNPPKYWQWAEI